MLDNCIPDTEELTPLPLIALLDAMVAEVRRRKLRRRKLRRLALFGARVTLETELFGWLRDVAEVVPLSPVQLEQVSAVYGKGERAMAVIDNAA